MLRVFRTLRDSIQIMDNRWDRKPGWIPYDLVLYNEDFLIEWCFIGQVILSDSWFEYTVNKAKRSMSNRQKPVYTRPDFLDQIQVRDKILDPAGFIYHASRTGSTLVSQMLSVSTRLSVLAEPPIIESMINHSATASYEDADKEKLPSRIYKIIQILSGKRLDDEEKVIIKFESEQIFDLDLFESIYPEVPWIYLLREPVYILYSHRKKRGRQMVPGMIATPRLDLKNNEIDPAQLDEYCAMMLEKYYASALRHLRAGKGKAVHYRRLPDFVLEELNEIFGLDLTIEEIVRMKKRSQYDSKKPYEIFGNEDRNRPGEIPSELKEMAQKRLMPLYEQLSEFDCS